MRLNISVPDALAAEVRQRGIPVSAVCQRALRDEVNGGPVTGDKCARCLAGLCGDAGDHQGCGPPGFAMPAVTSVAGTSCCGDCAPVLLELVLHPLKTVVVNPPAAIGGGGSGAAFGTRTRIGGGGGGGEAGG